MSSKRANLEAKSDAASTIKVPMQIDPASALRVKELLLTINRLTLRIFDCIDENQWSEQDMYQLLLFPVYANIFVQDMAEQAKKITDKVLQSR